MLATSGGQHRSRAHFQRLRLARQTARAWLLARRCYPSMHIGDNMIPQNCGMVNLRVCGVQHRPYRRCEHASFAYGPTGSYREELPASGRAISLRAYRSPLASLCLCAIAQRTVGTRAEVNQRRRTAVWPFALTLWHCSGETQNRLAALSLPRVTQSDIPPAGRMALIASEGDNP